MDGNNIFSVASLRSNFDDMGLRRCGPSTPWLKAIPTKVRILVWRMILDKLPTKDRLLKEGVEIDNTRCSICQGDTESAKHIFMDCIKTQEVRRLINNWWKILSDDDANIIRQNANSKKTIIAKEVVWYAFV